ncbi:methyltransferase family protein [Methanobrevibacter sp.]|uniref:methyltransferase family protein n=1 Tax=Methanobrevibacter sp. TaxID=66852 RepID=UPI003890137F
MKENNHLPVFGIGPYLIGLIAIVSILAILLSLKKIIPNYPTNQIITAVLGIVLIICGVIFWSSAVLKSRIDNNIRNNQLVTTGIYSIVRHPIYAAFLYAITGFIVMANNLILLILPVIHLLILTLAMKRTEEKWLIDEYGDDYLNYSKKVNRFIPKVI